jgi:hypothetical protein
VPGCEGLGSDECGSKSVEEDLECPRGLLNFFLGKMRYGGTYAKNTLPRTLLRSKSSKLVGRSVSIPS